VTIPFTHVELTKEKVSIFIVSMNGICMVVIAYFFKKIEILNDEYKDIMDNLTVQMSDFGI
jgi:hypothetical protein